MIPKLNTAGKEPVRTSDVYASRASALARPFSTHLLWTLNPLVLNITTRGSPEAVPVLLVVLTMHFLHLSTLYPTFDASPSPAPSISASSPDRSSHPSTARPTDSDIGGADRPSWSDSPTRGWDWEVAAALMYALSVSWKIYPVVYATAIWAGLSRRYGWFGWGVWRFGLVVLSGLVGINGVLWSM